MKLLKSKIVDLNYFHFLFYFILFSIFTLKNLELGLVWCYMLHDIVTVTVT